jgi:hypothetical protein
MRPKACEGLGVALLLCAATATLRAQYDDPRDYQPSALRCLYAGVMHPEFAPRSGNAVPDSLAIRFVRYMPMIGFRQGPVDIAFGYTRFRLNDGSRSAIAFTATAANEFVAAGGRGSTLLIPVLIALDFTKAESDGAQRDNFNVGSLGIGAGIGYRAVGRGVDVEIHAVEVFHYAFEGWTSRSGFSAATLAEARVHLADVPVADGIVLGYRLRFQTWSIGGTFFDYRLLTHGVTAGVAF